MSSRTDSARATHSWQRRISVSFQPRYHTPLLDRVCEGLGRAFQDLGHVVQAEPDGGTDVLVGAAPSGKALGWRDSLLFTARRRWGLDHSPTVFTLVPMSPGQFREALLHFERALSREPVDPKELTFDGLAPEAWRVLVDQGRRGGPILALLRLLQAQTKTIRIILVVGDNAPLWAFHFDLVGAYPRSDAANPDFYHDIAQRMVTTVSTSEVTDHEVVASPIPRVLWQTLQSPLALREAGLELGRRQFFTRMLRIADLTHVPVVADSVARQYSEGCFATWESGLNALVATVTGSARPVDKGNLGDHDLAVIVGVRPDGRGARIRHVEGSENLPPSSESVEMMEMDVPLPRIHVGDALGAPVVRSKLHGHRGVAAYDPARVEFVPLDEAYYNYIVSCATRAQADGIRGAFSRAECLRNPADPRQVAFTVLPGHGCVIVEKWVPGSRPFQTIWEYMDAGAVQIADAIPQGPMRFLPGSDGLMRLEHRFGEDPLDLVR